MRGDEVPHAPWVAATALTWPGVVSVFASSTTSQYALSRTLSVATTLGITQNDFDAGPVAILDHGRTLEVKLTQGSLSSVPEAVFLAGANLAAIGDGSPDHWELFQFQNAELIGENTYRLSGFLRGQQGTDAMMGAGWPAGAVFVLMNGVPQQLDLPLASRNVAQYYRIGPASKPQSDVSYQGYTHAFKGNGLRPYAPVSLKALGDAEGLKNHLDPPQPPLWRRLGRGRDSQFRGGRAVSD